MRQQQAMSAYWRNGGQYNDPEGHPDGAAAAVEVARTVELTPALVDTFAAGVSGETIHDFDGDEAAAGLRAVFKALGLRVVEP